MFVDNRGVKLFALGKVGLDRGGAECAAEVAHHVEEARGGSCLRRPDPDHRNGGDRGHDDRLAERPDNIGPEQLRRGIVLVEIKVHEAADGEDEQAGADEKARVDAFINSGTSGITNSCGSPVQAMTSPACSESKPCETARYCGSR